MRNDERNEQNTERLARRCEERLEQVSAQLDTLRRQPLDPQVLERVLRTERETERWGRVSAALQRPRARVLLLEEPSLVLARVLSGLREDWRGSGLDVVSSCRPLGPQRLDRRACMEALRVAADVVLASFEAPRRLQGHTRLVDDGPVFEIEARGEGAAPGVEDEWAAQVLAERAGGVLQLRAEAGVVTARMRLLPVEPACTAAPRYVFPWAPTEGRR